MYRRQFTTFFGAGALLAGTAGWSQGAIAQTPAFKPRPGKDFVELDKRAPVEAPAGRIEVVEFFWYSCPHCNAFEPAFEAWVKAAPKDVTVQRVPVGFREDFAPQQRLFYALEALGRLETMHRKVFQAIHVERQTLNRDDLVIAWAERQGLDKARFTEAYQSFGVGTKLRKANQLQDAYRVEGVPALGIAGRFYTDGNMAGTMDRALVVADALIAEVRKSR